MEGADFDQDEKFFLPAPNKNITSYTKIFLNICCGIDHLYINLLQKIYGNM